MMMTSKQEKAPIADPAITTGNPSINSGLPVRLALLLRPPKKSREKFSRTQVRARQGLGYSPEKVPAFLFGTGHAMCAGRADSAFGFGMSDVAARNQAAPKRSQESGSQSPDER